MNNIWRLIVCVRNSSYQRAIKGFGLEGAESEYKLNFIGSTSGYVITFILIIYNVSLNFHNGLKYNEYPLLIRLLLAIAVVYLPMKLVNYFLLKKVEHIPIPKKFDENGYKKHRRIYWVFLLAGQIMWICVWIIGLAIWNFF